MRTASRPVISKDMPVVLFQTSKAGTGKCGLDVQIRPRRFAKAREAPRLCHGLQPLSTTTQRFSFESGADS
jgi:hypothetical protein